MSDAPQKLTPEELEAALKRWADTFPRLDRDLGALEKVLADCARDLGVQWPPKLGPTFRVPKGTDPRQAEVMLREARADTKSPSLRLASDDPDERDIEAAWFDLRLARLALQEERPHDAGCFAVRLALGVAQLARRAASRAKARASAHTTKAARRQAEMFAALDRAAANSGPDLMVASLLAAPEVDALPGHPRTKERQIQRWKQERARREKSELS